MYRLFRVIDHDDLEWQVAAADPAGVAPILGRWWRYYGGGWVTPRTITDITDEQLAAPSGASLRALLTREVSGPAALHIDGHNPRPPFWAIRGTVAGF